MEVIKKRRPVDILRGFFWLSHPGPVLFHLLAVTVFALLAAWPHVLWRILVLVIGAHLAMQLSIAVLNDYFDRQRDMLSKKNKPIVRGLVRPREALITGLLLILIMLLLLLPLNPLALLVSLLYLALGQGYNLGLKATPLSGIVFALAIPLIPVYAFVGVGRIVPFVFWLVPVAALLGVSLNLANSLPDIEEDAASHARTLAVVLGVRGSFIACPLLILLATISIGGLAISGLVSARPWILLPTLLLACLAVGALFVFFGPRTSLQDRKLYFYLVVLTCLVLAGGWLISVAI
ncbi:MAG: UbiA family prenyltransferase [Ktedonobacteraceae bacterium]|nr:UbiA family prenyltransferase [Ktedonobacteraceae bacterium]